MKAIEFTFNGKIICHAGLPKCGNIGAVLTLMAAKDVRDRKKWSSFISVGGLSVEGDDNRFLTFTEKAISEKDTIGLRIVDVDQPSRPKSQRIETKKERLKAKQKYLKGLSKELGGKK